MTEARTRFEQSLQLEKNENQKNIDDFHSYMDETSKFQELRDLKYAQNKALIKNVLE